MVKIAPSTDPVKNLDELKKYINEIQEYAYFLHVDVMNSITGTNNDGTVASYDEAGISKRRDERHLLFPLPTSEVSTNEAIDSNNPGWN